MGLGIELKFDLDAETSVLSSILLSSEAMNRVADVLTPGSFYFPAHAHIFRVAIGLFKDNAPVDIITVRTELERLDLLESVGGVGYLLSLQSTNSLPSNIDAYAKVVEETAVRRGLQEAGQRILDLGSSWDVDTPRALSDAEREIAKLVNDRNNDEPLTLDEGLSDFWIHSERKAEDSNYGHGILTGLHDLDRMTGGLQPASLIVLAARPSVGKTSLGLGIAQHVAMEAGVPVGVFSLEMSRRDLVTRMVSSRAEVDSRVLLHGKPSPQQWVSVAKAVLDLSKCKIYIDDHSTQSVIDIRSRARKLKVRYGVELIVIDYIQLMNGSKRSENRVQEVSEISRALKSLARDLDIPIIALSQLSRATEQRTDRRPQLSDLRESGAIEQDSDIVMFLYREGLHNPDVPRTQTNLIIAKHRNGPVGDVQLIFIESQTRFVNATGRTHG